MGGLRDKVRTLTARAAAWRLPVRISAPSRDEWFAAGLSTLAFGLVLGLATGPVGGPGIIFPAFAAPVAETVSEGEDEVALPTLGAPAGSNGGPSLAAVPPPAPAAPAPAPAPPVPSEPPTGSGGGGGGSGGGDDGGDEQRDGLPITATVVSTAVTGKSYAVADEAGNLFTIYGNGVPGVGDRIGTSIEPLANGTFLEISDRRLLGERSSAAMRGIVSYLDPESGIVVLSSRGVSIALEGSRVFEQEIEALREGASAEAEVEMVEPDPEDPEAPAEAEPEPDFSIVSLDASFYEGSPIELTGKLKDLDRPERLATFAADSGGLLEAEVDAVAPNGLELASLKVGFTYSVTLREGSGGALRIAGLSPAWGQRPANDPALAFGEHG
jgi:hypothetical protein